MIGIGLGKGKGLAHKASQTLAEGVVEAFNMRRVATLLADRLMVGAQPTEDGIIAFPEIAEGGTVTVLGWNPRPESPTALFGAVADEEGDNLPSAPTERQPNPALVLLGTDEASHFVQFQHILGRGWIQWGHHGERFGFFSHPLGHRLSAHAKGAFETA